MRGYGGKGGKHGGACRAFTGRMAKDGTRRADGNGGIGGIRGSEHGVAAGKTGIHPPLEKHNHPLAN